MEGKAIISLVLAVGLAAVVGTVLLGISQETNDAIGLGDDPANETYGYAMTNLTSSVETGFKMTKVMVMIVVMGILIGALGLKKALSQMTE